MALYSTARWSAFRILWSGIVLAWPIAVPPVSADEARFVTFRDGSRLRVELPKPALEFAEANSSGAEILRGPLTLDNVSRIEFSSTPGLAKMEVILRKMTFLNADDFLDRELASQWLLRNTTGFQPLLDQRLAAADLSPESRWRLRSILQWLPRETVAANQRPFDRIYLDEGGTRDGDFGNWALPATFRGTTLPLTRPVVATIARDWKTGGNEAEVSPRRLDGPDDPTFSPEARTLGFETDTNGRALKVGDDIGTRFVGDGVTFSTSATGGFVSVNAYEVSGPSRGLSAATHDPLYEGMVTIRFCMPGNPGVPAGVQGVGLWLAVVKQNGTTLQAFDASDELITEISTTGPPSEFLGLWSEVPIHALRLVPSPDIDPNYTLDDLIFTSPRPVDGLGVEEFPTLSFRNGDRVVCREFMIENGEIAYSPASFDAVTIRSDFAEIQTLYAPITKKPAPVHPTHYWIELSDGTRLLASPDNGPSLPRLPLLEAGLLTPTALWGAVRVPFPLPATTPWDPKEGPLLVDERGARILPPARLGLAWIEPEGEPFPDGIAATYADSPTIWFSRPAKPAAGVGQVRFPNGERIILGGDAGFRLKAFTATVITIEREDMDWTFPFSATSALHLPAP